MKFLRIAMLRLTIAIPVLFLVSLGTFALVALLPGEPARALAGGDLATPADIARVRADLGLDDPFFVQYFRWLADALRFDFGTSLIDRRPVSDVLIDRMPATLSIALFAVVVAVLLGLVTGISAGIRPGTVVDKLSVGIATVGIAVPSFIVAIAVVQVFALHWRIFPAVRYVPFGESPWDWLRSIALPGLSLGLLGAGALSRQLRSSLIETVNADYVRTSWSVGSGARTAVGRHALKNSSIPAVAVLASQLTFLLGGTVVIEQIFAVNGIGTYLFRGALETDLPVIRAVVMWFAVVQIAVYLLADIVLVALNPRMAVQ